MPKYKYILSIDPSGNGTSGFCLLESSGKVVNLSELCVNDYRNLPDYWAAHNEKIRQFTNACGDKLVVAIEDFLLNPKKAKQMSGSRMETSKLIGIIQLYCWKDVNVPFQMIKPLDHLSRFTDNTLCNLGVIYKTKRGFDTADGISLTNHTKDALRIATFYNKLFNSDVGAQ